MSNAEFEDYEDTIDWDKVMVATRPTIIRIVDVGFGDESSLLCDVAYDNDTQVLFAVDRARVLLAAAIEIWCRSGRSITDLTIEMEGFAGVESRDLDSPHEHPGSLVIDVRPRHEDECGLCPDDVVPIVARYDDGCGGQGYVTFVYRDGTLALDASREDGIYGGIANWFYKRGLARQGRA